MGNEMEGKICLITGGTHGIGKATAHTLAGMGATVLIHGRYPEKGRRAANEISEKNKNGTTRFVQADFASLAQVRKLAAELNESLPRLDVLINNAAGMGSPERQLTQDGHELTFGVNHLAHFLLTQLLLDKIIASAPARIVVVSSSAYRLAKFDSDDLMTEKNYGLMRAYGRSKLANLLFVHELAKRLNGTGVDVNALHPGGVMTMDSETSQERRGARKIMMKLLGPFLKTPMQGARTSVYLASSPEVEGKSGDYYIDCKPAKVSEDARSDVLATRLWKESERLVESEP